MLKKIVIVLGILALVVGAGLYYVYRNLDEIAEAAIERNGSRALGAEVEVGSVEIKPGEGRATIRDLTVANPPGYSENPLFSFSEITAEADLKNMVVTRLFSDRPTVRVEMKDADNNLLALRRNLRRISSPDTKAESPSTATETDQGAVQTDAGKEESPNSGLQLQIDLVEITNMQARVFKDDNSEPLAASIDEIRFTNLKGTRLEIARQITQQLVAIVVAEVIEASLREKLEDRYGDALKEMGGKLKKLLE
ncbi:MAG: hypothetical protein U9Q71_09605 [Pseudomonadota bacterium]|nr:hypothetical protein [Pseudomonadota bacterium]